MRRLIYRQTHWHNPRIRKWYVLPSFALAASFFSTSLLTCGIVGGELFDYILSHRYLKDHVACKLFAQLISGVSYLHEKGIVHRDLKLENLLLDQNRNIIITDFGFANTFNPEEVVDDKDIILASEDNRRVGDLMQTSCGSPCYAAPELVATDGRYAGRKVDVWSGGVILGLTPSSSFRFSQLSLLICLVRNVGWIPTLR